MKELCWYTEWKGKRLGANRHMFGDFSKLYGDCTFLSGDVSGLSGDCTDVACHATNLFGDLDDVGYSTYTLKHTCLIAVDVDPS